MNENVKKGKKNKFPFFPFYSHQEPQTRGQQTHFSKLEKLEF
jgi:hypothetical protein